MRQIVKKFLLKDLCVVILLTVLICLICFVPGVRTLTESHSLKSFYSKSEYDFVVVSPGKTQCQELEGLPFIDLAVPFYKTTAELLSQGKVFANSNIIILNDFREYVGSFSFNRLICESSSDISLPLAFIDYNACKEYRLGIGDTFTATILNREYDFFVSKIFEPAFDGDKAVSMIMLFADDSLKEILGEYSYSGAYVKSRDHSGALYYLSNEYIAEGDLRERNQFDSEEAFKLYNEAVMKSRHFVVDMQQIGETFLNYSDYEVKGIIYCILGIFLNACGLAFVFIKKTGNNTFSYYKSLFRLGVSQEEVEDQLRNLFIIESIVSSIVIMTLLLATYRLYYLPCVPFLILMALIVLVISIIEALIFARHDAKKICTICQEEVKEIAITE